MICAGVDEIASFFYEVIQCSVERGALQVARIPQCRCRRTCIGEVRREVRQQGVRSVLVSQGVRRGNCDAAGAGYRIEFQRVNVLLRAIFFSLLPAEDDGAVLASRDTE